MDNLAECPQKAMRVVTVLADWKKAKNGCYYIVKNNQIYKAQIMGFIQLIDKRPLNSEGDKKWLKQALA